MSGQRDFPLPIAGEAAETPPENPWPVEVEPTNLIALWPGGSPPTRVEIIAALESHFETAAAQVHELDNHDAVLWNGVFTLPGMGGPVVIWSEPARPLPAGALDDPAARQCKWVVGVETALQPEHAFDEYETLLRCLAAAIQGPAILDVITHQWHHGEFLSDLTAAPPAQPPVEVLWTIHAVGDRARNDRGERWLHTHGLCRCGLPELEMLEVPADHAQSGASLINHLAAMAIDAGLPPAGEPFEIGQGMAVVLQPLLNVVKQVAAVNSGGPDDRAGDDNPHGGIRAVVCDPRQRGVFRKQWVWPADAVATLEGEGAVVYRSHAATRRAAELARNRWDEMALAFASARASGAVGGPKAAMAFLIKATLAPVAEQADQSTPTPEHLWFELQRFDGAVAHCKLINTPIEARSANVGDIVPIRRDMVSDWSVYSAAGHFGPGDVPALRRALHAMQEGKP